MNQAMFEFVEGKIGADIWYYMSENPDAIDLLEANQDKINWNGLSANPAAIDLLKANPDKIEWERLAINPRIHEVVDYLMSLGSRVPQLDTSERLHEKVQSIEFEIDQLRETICEKKALLLNLVKSEDIKKLMSLEDAIETKNALLTELSELETNIAHLLT